MGMGLSKSFCLKYKIAVAHVPLTVCVNIRVLQMFRKITAGLKPNNMLSRWMPANIEEETMGNINTTFIKVLASAIVRAKEGNILVY